MKLANASGWMAGDKVDGRDAGEDPQRFLYTCRCCEQEYGDAFQVLEEPTLCWPCIQAIAAERRRRLAAKWLDERGS